MKQSERIQYCKEYNKHPLKKEYDAKRDLICKNKPISVYLINLGYLFFVFMFFFCGWLFFSKSGNALTRELWFAFFSSSPFFGDMLFVLALGIGNIVIGFLYIIYSMKWKEDLIKEHNKSKLDILKKEYRKKGLYEVQERELYEHECCEYDDYKEAIVCCVTKQPLSSQEYNFCHQPGNCKQCRTFVSAYFGPDAVEWWGKSHEYKK
ncbi:MAG: hypothetical protein ACI4IN_00315 [Eubacterium sp.]